MANGNIGEVPASLFAESVPASLLPEFATDGAFDATEDEIEVDDDDSAPHCSADAVAKCPTVAVRPPLVQRLWSAKLIVRSLAKLQRDRLLGPEMIDIYVGEAKRRFSIHRNLLFHHSALLESELQGDGKKKPDTLELLEYDPAGFELLVKWLYQGKLDDVSDMVSPHTKYDYAVNCHKLYLLCERFDMPQLKNVAMDQYRKGLNEAELVPDAEEINDIYRNSPVGSPFRVLMTRIAARQIMDPESARDVGTYRECFEANPDFGLDLVSAIKQGTGGMLFDDPTDAGNECEYHDHEAGPNCHIKGKGTKQALKATAHLRDPSSAKYDPSANFAPRLRPHRPPRLIQNPQPLPRQARPQDGISVGPLRRRLTSPVSSTVGTSTENVIATLPSPKEQRDKFRRVTPPEKRPPNPTLVETSPPAQGVRPPSSAGESHPVPDSSTSDKGGKTPSPKQVLEDTSPRRNIWKWATVGTGRLGIMGRIPHPGMPGILTSKAVTSAVAGALDDEGRITGSLDDFSVPSSTSTEPTEQGISTPAQNGILIPTENGVINGDAIAADFDGLGISNGIVESALFSQTRMSSDDLVASMNDTPSPMWDRSGSASRRSPPTTPSPLPSISRLKELNSGSKSPNPPQPPKLTSNGDSDSTQSPQLPKENVLNGVGTSVENTPSPRRIPKYKIALNANILSPSRTVTT